MLLDVPGVSTTMPVKLSRPLPRLIKEWVQASAHEDLPASLAALEQAINGKRSWPASHARRPARTTPEREICAKPPSLLAEKFLIGREVPFLGLFEAI